MGALAAAYGVEAVVTILAAVGLAAWLRRRTKVGYGLVGVGALVFIVSQIVHLPLNWGTCSRTRRSSSRSAPPRSV